MATGAMIGSAVIGVAGSAMQASAAGKASDAMAAASREAAKVTWDMYQQTREDMTPWRAAGAGAINALWGTPGTPEQTIQGAPIYGGGQGANALPQQYYVQLGGEGGPTIVENPAYAAAIASGAGQPQITGYQPSTTIPATQGTTGLIQQGPGEFKPEEEPGYVFGYEEFVEKPTLRAAAATGNLGSGKTLKALSRYASDYASTKYDTFLDRYYKSLDPYFRVAGMGSNVAMAGGSQGNQAASNMSNALMYGGTARTSGYTNQGNIWGNALSGMGQNLMDYGVLKKMGYID